MANDGETFEIDATENTIFLVLSGVLIVEPITAQGVFIMNSREELVQAFNDFNTDILGYLEDQSYNPFLK